MGKSAPKQIFLNEYDWGFGGAYFLERKDAVASAVKRTRDSDDEDYIKTHEYKLVQP